MAYPIPANSLLEIQIVGLLNGQTTRSVFHYWYPTGAAAIIDGELSAEGFIADFVAGPYDSILSAQSQDWTLQYLQAQWIVPTRYRAIQQDSAASGADPAGRVASVSLPSGVAVCVGKEAQLAGRSHAGRNWFPGIPAVHVVESVLTDPGLALWQAVAADVLASLNDGVSAEVQPVVVGKGQNGATEKILHTSQARRTIRYQRRREVGKGE